MALCFRFLFLENVVRTSVTCVFTYSVEKHCQRFQGWWQQQRVM